MESVAVDGHSEVNMTCIVAIVDEKGVGHMASDSIGSNGHTRTVYKDKKIFLKDNMLIGYTSSYRMGQLIQYSLNLPARKTGQSIENYMHTDFINAIRNLFKDSGYGEKETYGTFIVIAEGRVFSVQSDLSVLESADNFDTCGSGGDFALAAIDILVGQGKKNYKDILIKAVETAEKYVATVGGDIYYLKQ